MLAAAAGIAGAEPAARAAKPAEGGAPLVRAAETASRVVLGTVRAPTALDTSGQAASLEVERVLSGVGRPGERLRFGWEELARSRPPRFAEGSRIVVALQPMPSSSLWRRRFPEGGDVVGADGNGFLRDPDPRTLDLLEAWARLAPQHREGEPGATALSALAAGATPALAAGALARLSEIPGLESRLSSDGAAHLLAALDDGQRPEALRRQIVDLAAARRLGALRPAVAQHAKPRDPLEAPALDALRALDGTLPPERVRSLLGRSEPAVRAAGVRAARGPDLDRVVRLLATDTAGEVRLAAVEVLVSERGLASFEATSLALFDPDAGVRAGAARALSSLGAPAVPGLEALLAGRQMPAAGAVLGALVLAGPEGQAAVQKASERHADPTVRAAAALALGRGPAEH